jgi:hypothetical protein
MTLLLLLASILSLSFPRDLVALGILAIVGVIAVSGVPPGAGFVTVTVTAFFRWRSLMFTATFLLLFPD